MRIGHCFDSLLCFIIYSVFQLVSVKNASGFQNAEDDFTILKVEEIDIFRGRQKNLKIFNTGVSSMGVAGVPWHPKILADQLTLSQPGWVNYAHQIILAPPDFQTFQWP